MKTRLLYFFLLFTFISALEAQDLYDLDFITTINITFEESNWDYLMDQYYSNDNGEKLMGSLVINGEAFDSIGVKYKGNSTYSANNAKNPLHIYLDYMIDQDYNGYESIKLSNGKNDPSFVREVLSYEIARKYMKAPLSNYAQVYINGSYYGLFSSSEAINKDFVDRRIYADKDNTRFKCNPENTSNGGSSLSYIDQDSSSYADFYELKSDAGWQDLIDLTYGIANTPEAIESLLDIDHAIWMLAFDNVLVNLDSYLGPFRQNYYLIMDDNERFVPVIWDLNESLGAFEQTTSSGGGGGGGFPGGGVPPRSIVATEGNTTLQQLDPFLREDDDSYPLIKMIFDNERYRKMYVAHCKTMLEENFVNDWYYDKADTLQALIYDAVDDDNNKFYTLSQFTSNLNNTESQTIGITELMSARVSYLQGLAAFNYTSPTISDITAPEAPSPFTTVDVSAAVSNANYVYLAYRHSKDEVFTKVEMLDDGSHNDGEANDGIYGVSFEVDESNTHYYIYAENSEAGIFSPQRAEHEYYKIAAEAVEAISSDLVINEIMASNSEVVKDEYDEYDDWVELYNNTNEDISLSGYYLSDDDEDLMQWSFPDTIIKANSYLIVWTDKDNEQGTMHTNFKLSSSGESVVLVNQDLSIVNNVEYNEQITDMCYARNANGTGDFQIQAATFAYNNEETEYVAGLDENTLVNKVYPNPVSHTLSVEVIQENIESLRLINLTGQTVYAEHLDHVSKVDIDMSTYRSGIYMLILSSDHHQEVTRIVKE